MRRMDFSRWLPILPFPSALLDQLREIAHFELMLELRADIDDGLVADIELVRDIAVRLALGQKRERLQLTRRQLGQRIFCAPAC